MATSAARVDAGGRKGSGRGRFDVARRALQAAIERGGAVHLLLETGDVAERDVTLPPELMPLVLDALKHLALGQAVSVVPAREEISSQQAADLLGVSRPFLVRLLDEGRLPSRKVGVRRRVRMKDLLAFKQNEYAYRSALLDALAVEGQAIDADYPPGGK